MDGEQAYLFRHVLMRDAAYQLQLPADRSRLHALAAALLENEVARRDEQDGPGKSEALADEIALHFRLAQGGADLQNSKTAEHRRRELHWLERAARHFLASHDVRQAVARLDELASATELAERKRLEFALDAADALQSAGQWRELQPRLESLTSQALALNDLHLVLRAKLFDVVYRSHTFGAATLQSELRELLALARQCGHGRTEAFALLELAELERDAMKIKASLEAAEEAAALRGSAEEFVGTLSECGAMHHKLLHDDAEAERKTRQAVELARSNGFEEHEMEALRALGYVLVESGRWREARQCYRASRDLAYRYGMTSAAAQVEYLLANLDFYFSGEAEQAGRQYERAKAVLVECGDNHGVARLQKHFARFLAVTGQADKALRESLESLAFAQRAADGAMAASLLCDMALRALATDPGTAADHYQRAKEISAACGSADEQSIATIGQLWIELDLGRLDNVEQLLLELDELGRRSNNRYPRSHEWAGLACAWLLLGRDDKARELFNASRGAENPDEALYWMTRFRKPLMRLAVWDCVGPLGLQGPHEAEGLALAHAIRADVRKVVQTLEASLVPHFRECEQFVEQLWQEIARKVERGEPACAFRGRLPHTMTPALRRALLQRLEVDDAASLELLRSQNPKLYEQMTRDV